jgi:hypothetical protein
MKETQTILLKTYRPNSGRVALSDGLLKSILRVTQVSALQSKEVWAGCQDRSGEKWFPLQVQHQLSSCLDSEVQKNLVHNSFSY